MLKIKKRVIALCGSTRSSSTNLNLIKAITELAKDKFAMSVFEGLTILPHFNPDLDTDNPPKEVRGFRNLLKKFDGILVCTPEYAMGVPGTLKNAIDWTVSSMEFSKKPVALITASSSGHKAHAALIDTLNVIEAKMTPDTQLLISFIKTKVNKEGKIIDDKTLNQVTNLIAAFGNIMESETVH
jgi:chromate reductase, NAD(P)H dehydrogenase (quinone)